MWSINQDPIYQISTQIDETKLNPPLCLLVSLPFFLNFQAKKKIIFITHASAKNSPKIEAHGSIKRHVLKSVAIHEKRKRELGPFFF